MALTDGLVDYYKLDESGGANDALGLVAVDLTQVSSPGSAAGKIETSRDMAVGDYFYSTNSIWNWGDTDRFFNGWYFPTVGGFEYLHAKDGWTVNDRDHYLRMESDETLKWLLFNGGGGVIANLATTDTLTLNAWNMVSAWHSATDNEAGVVINSGTPVTGATSGAHGDSGYQFRLGDNHNDPSSRTFTGRIDEFGMWDRVLTSVEISQLYNGGDGLAYPFTTSLGLRGRMVNFG